MVYATTGESACPTSSTVSRKHGPILRRGKVGPRPVVFALLPRSPAPLHCKNFCCTAGTWRKQRDSPIGRTPTACTRVWTSCRRCPKKTGPGHSVLVWSRRTTRLRWSACLLSAAAVAVPVIVVGVVPTAERTSGKGMVIRRSLRCGRVVPMAPPRRLLSEGVDTICDPLIHCGHGTQRTASGDVLAGG